MFTYIYKELRRHIPFTAFGAATGIVIVILLQDMLPATTYYHMFYILHPVHVVLSALVTSSVFKFHNPACNLKCNFWLLLLIGYLGSIGIATLSDSLIPYLGEYLMNMPNKEIHIGFIEKWWLVNPLAVLGVTIAYYWPSTKFPHAGHVLLSTWASMFHILMAMGEGLTLLSYLIIFIFLFLGVWIPCCVSDIVFPLLLIKEPEGTYDEL